MDIKLFLKDFQGLFENKISEKNSWGKNEVMRVFKDCITDAIVEVLNGESNENP